MRVRLLMMDHVRREAVAALSPLVVAECRGRKPRSFEGATSPHRRGHDRAETASLVQMDDRRRSLFRHSPSFADKTRRRASARVLALTGPGAASISCREFSARPPLRDRAPLL